MIRPLQPRRRTPPEFVLRQQSRISLDELTNPLRLARRNLDAKDIRRIKLNAQLKARQSALAAARWEEHHKEVAVRSWWVRQTR